jgi:hypothetical protein
LNKKKIKEKYDKVCVEAEFNLSIAINNLESREKVRNNANKLFIQIQ